MSRFQRLRVLAISSLTAGATLLIAVASAYASGSNGPFPK
jgi:zinc transporter ZupT